MIMADYKAYNMSFWRLLRGFFTGHTFYAVLLFRQANWMVRKRIKLLPEMWTFMARRVFSCELAPNATIGGGLRMPHSVGIVVGWDAKIGSNCEIFQNVTIGSSRKNVNEQIMPVIGDNVTIYAGAVITGPIKIGNNVVIGANSVVTRDVPDNCFVAGAPAKIIKTFEESTDECNPNI